MKEYDVAVCGAGTAGVAAAVAAAMAASNGCDPVEVPVAELRKELVAAGAVVDAAPDWGIPTEKTEKVPEYSEV